jgi:hypothetical protein
MNPKFTQQDNMICDIYSITMKLIIQEYHLENTVVLQLLSMLKCKIMIKTSWKMMKSLVLVVDVR